MNIAIKALGILLLITFTVVVVYFDTLAIDNLISMFSPVMKIDSYPMSAAIPVVLAGMVTTICLLLWTQWDRTEQELIKLMGTTVVVGAATLLDVLAIALVYRTWINPQDYTGGPPVLFTLFFLLLAFAATMLCIWICTGNKQEAMLPGETSS